MKLFFAVLEFVVLFFLSLFISMIIVLPFFLFYKLFSLL